MATMNNNNITSMRTLVDAMDAFLTTVGFTQNSAPTGTTSGSAAWSAGECFVRASWTTQTELRLQMSEGYSGGATNVTNYFADINTFGAINLTTAEVWGFANNAATATERYAHFVLEFNKDGRYVHFGFGHLGLDKYSDWDGGAYVYGGEWNNGASAAQEPYNANHRHLLDGNHTGIANTVNLPQMTVRNLPGQAAAGRFAILTNSNSAPSSNDGNGNALVKVEGYSRHGPWPSTLLHVAGNPANAWIPLVPIELAYHRSSTSRMLLGRMPDIRNCNIGNIQPKETLTIGADDWMFFPWGQKLTNGGSAILSTRNAGVAYKVI